ncbi:hypothetical protein NQ661_10170 [Acinetobacter baumannii]|uniref:hypothetical protein n=1 Tax=Acinetobacter baumannii TaxID=470 RepID=UPI0002CECEEC|nr:hypothetical protein [Acinetobacter baumannii]ENW51008.1 hypothetical protein F917_02445 [Acinetobacter baumannii NIPH 67]MDC4324270.1 hypothetical protein [Acinetobacter baumannii]MDC4835614.1 hypothetical protein [Acinetobacter baumannii]MDK2184526.1 hypothetical protein [Acinetobacter baumannii]MDK2257336.1 hypothetical protein [Acinetobacter baumannii]
MLRNIDKIVLYKLYLILENEIFNCRIVAKEAYLIRLDIVYLELSEDLQNLIDELISMDTGEEGEFSLTKDEIIAKINSIENLR